MGNALDDACHGGTGGPAQSSSQKRVNHQVGVEQGSVERSQVLAEHFDDPALLFATPQVLGRSSLHVRAICREEDARRPTASAQEPSYSKSIAAIVAFAAQDNGFNTVVRYLVGQGADLHAANARGETPLATAMRVGRVPAKSLVYGTSTADLLRELGAQE